MAAVAAAAPPPPPPPPAAAHAIQQFHGIDEVALAALVVLAAVARGSGHLHNVKDSERKTMWREK